MLHTPNRAFESSGAGRYLFVTIALSALAAAGCSTAPPAQPSRVYAGPESYLIGKRVEAVAQVYGNPGKSNTVGNTTFVTYSAPGRSGSRYENICFLEIQADRETGVIRQASTGSNLGITSQRFGFDVRQDCNRLFYREQLAQ